MTQVSLCKVALTFLMKMYPFGLLAAVNLFTVARKSFVTHTLNAGFLWSAVSKFNSKRKVHFVVITDALAKACDTVR